MASRTDAGSDFLSLTTGLPSVAGAFTVAMWLYISVDRNDYSVPLAFQDSNHGGLQFDNTGTGLCVANDNDGTASTNIAVTTWAHVCWVHRSDSDNELWVNGALVADAFAMSIGAFSAIYFGSYNGTSSFFFNGRICAIKWWEAALTASQVPDEQYTIYPQTWDSLYAFWPVFPGSTERVKDYSGHGHDFTNNGTLADEDPPPLEWGDMAPPFVVPASGSVTGDASITFGALTSSAAGTVDVVGSLNKTLGALTTSSAGTVDIVGSATPTLGALVTTSAGAVDVVGTATPTLGAVTLSAAGTVDIVGVASNTLGALTSSAAGTTDVVGALSKTLGALTTTSAATADIVGSQNSTLGALTLSATATTNNEVTGELSVTLGTLTVSSAGAVDIVATLSQTLGALRLTAGDVVPQNGDVVVIDYPSHQVSLRDSAIHNARAKDYAAHQVFVSDDTGG